MALIRSASPDPRLASGMSKLRKPRMADMRRDVAALNSKGAFSRALE